VLCCFLPGVLGATSYGLLQGFCASFVQAQGALLVYTWCYIEVLILLVCDVVLDKKKFNFLLIKGKG
jgi:hypothetical protein